MNDLKAAIQMAEGYCDLGMWTDAGDVLENLGFWEKKTPGVLRIKARCLVAKGKWEEGLMVAMLLRKGDAACRSTAAEFFHHLAVYHMGLHEENRALVAVRMACRCYPAHAMIMIADERLARVFKKNRALPESKNT